MWAAEEIRALLPDPVEGAAEGTTLGDVFMHHYGVKENGNVSPMQVRVSKDLPGTGSIGGRTCTPGHGGTAEQPQSLWGPTPPQPGGIPRVGLSFQDPHQELKGKNVLIVRCSPELTTARFGLEPARLGALLQEGRRRLSAARAQRPRPHLDTKMLAAWNGERWLSSGDVCRDRTPPWLPRASRILGACSNESCWDWSGPHGGGG